LPSSSIYKSTDAKKKRTEAGLKQKITEIVMEVARAIDSPALYLFFF
jgi:NTP pyrophosphatase (non-canonical NTP hydrolase)